MAKHTRPLKVFLVRKDQPAHPPTPEVVLTVEADTLDGLLPAAELVLVERGYDTHRAISFSPAGLTAYVEVA